MSKESPIPAVLSMDDISKHYGATKALHHVNFYVYAGEVHALVGENGAGKSTLMKIISGAIKKDSGEIRLNGEKINIHEPSEAQRKGIRVVYQDFSLFPNITVAENLIAGNWSKGIIPGLVNWKDCNARAEQLLKRIGFQIDVRRRLGSLRVAEKQMLEIAKAVADNPKILILDEPTAVLEDEEVHQLFNVIRAAKGAGTAIIYISHRLDEVFELSDRVTVLKDGEVVSSLKTVATNKEELIKLMVGRDLGEIYPHRTSQKARPLLEVRNLNCDGKFHHVNFTLHEGEIIGFAGLVGSGRTEVAKCIFGADRFSGGEILLEGKPVSLKSPAKAIANGIAFLTEDRKKDGLFLDVNIGQNIIAPSLARFNKFGVMARKKESAAISNMIKKLGVKPADPSRLVRYLSGGNQQKIALAKWLLTDSKVIILDQPTWGVDVGTMMEIYHFIAEMADKGKAVMLISCVLPEIIGLSDRIIVMREGTTVAELEKAEATEENILAHAMGVSQ